VAFSGSDNETLIWRGAFSSVCGIFGVTFAERPRRNLGEILKRALERLEYRGYDSAGVAVVDKGLVVRKDAGKVAEVATRYGFDSLQGVAGLAHTRWATHGKPDQTNAHPHTDCRGVIAVVHNGIIENYAELREELAKRGHVFRSETDTEVVAHLVEEYRRQGLDAFSAFRKALSRIKGAYAIALIDAENPQIIYFARNLSPLIIGVGDGFNIVASDIPTVLDHTGKGDSGERRRIRLHNAHGGLHRGRRGAARRGQTHRGDPVERRDGHHGRIPALHA
jgi:glutamine--fructose-6-phosphate transaminase (EC 2.6.1.16)